MRKLLVVDFLGGDFNGWQKQGHDLNTVQGEIERALGKVANEAIEVHAAGRTDRGVHAINMTAHFDTTVTRDAYSWMAGGNSHLPRSIRIRDVVDVPDEFHARKMAMGRSYRYVLCVAPTLSPFLRGRVGWVFTPLDFKKVEAAIPLLVGERDFSSFRSSECQAPSPIKDLRSITVRIKDGLWIFDFEASGFLHHMVRNLMGALVEVGRGNLDLAGLEAIVEAKDRTKAPPTFMSDGLYFTGASYEEKWNLPPMRLPEWFFGEG